MRTKKTGMDNIGIKARLELCGVELDALEQWKPVKFLQESNFHRVAHYAMLFAVTNPKKFSDWIDNIDRYCKAEDIHPIDHVRSLLAAQYRTKKNKIHDP